MQQSGKEATGHVCGPAAGRPCLLADVWRDRLWENEVVLPGEVPPKFPKVFGLKGEVELRRRAQQEAELTTA